MKSSFVLVLLMAATPVIGDVLILRDGKVATGTVLQQNSAGVLIRLDYGTFTYPTSMVKTVERTPEAVVGESSVEPQKIPEWGQIVSRLAEEEWATELRQIPATVINTGVLRQVPYISFQCGTGGYELNIYGDLDRPAGVEIGVLKFNLKNERAKSNCVDIISALLPAADRLAVRNLEWKKDLVTREGVTFEVTPPSDPDSYGGWWVSVYDTEALETARASESEMLVITEPVAPKLPPRYAVSPPTRTPAVGTYMPGPTWTSDDYSASRSSRGSYSSGGTSGGGTVYVKGYYRKDGTYVKAHTRRSPRR